MDGTANPLMDREVVGVVFYGVVAMVAVVTLPKTAGSGVVLCSCSCSVACGVTKGRLSYARAPWHC